MSTTHQCGVCGKELEYARTKDTLCATCVKENLKDGKTATIPFSKMKPADKFLYKWMEVAEDGRELRHGRPVCQRLLGHEYVFHPGRKWAFDFTWPELKVAVEIDGFGYGHQAQQCLAQDNEKQNAAIELGWTVLRYNSRQLGSHGSTEEAVRQVCRVLISAGEGAVGNAE